MNWAWFIVIGAFLLAIGTIIFNDTPAEQNFANTSINAPVVDSQEQVQDLGYYQFNYYFNSDVPEARREQFIKAFNLISEATNNSLRFTQQDINLSADFIINYQVHYSQDKVGSGEETLGTSYILGKSYYPYYNSYPDTITIMPQDINELQHCKGYPMTELHEIMHGLGLNHSNSAQSIMTWSSGNCVDLLNDTETLIKLKQEWSI